MNFNDVVARILRSPLHGLLSGSTMLLTVTGRKSGRSITLPVNYVQAGDTLWVISLATRTWWRNLLGGGSVNLVLRHQARSGKGRVTVGDEAGTVQALQRFLAVRPTWANRFGVHRTPEGGFDLGDLTRAAAARAMVEIQLTG